MLLPTDNGNAIPTDNGNSIPTDNGNAIPTDNGNAIPTNNGDVAALAVSVIPAFSPYFAPYPPRGPVVYAGEQDFVQGRPLHLRVCYRGSMS